MLTKISIPGSTRRHGLAAGRGLHCASDQRGGLERPGSGGCCRCRPPRRPTGRRRKKAVNQLVFTCKLHCHLPVGWDHPIASSMGPLRGPTSRPRKIVTEAVDAVKRGLSTRVGQEIVHRLSGTARVMASAGLGAQRPARESARSGAFLGAPGMDVGHRSRPLGRALPSLGSSALPPSGTGPVGPLRRGRARFPQVRCGCQLPPSLLGAVQPYPLTSMPEELFCQSGQSRSLARRQRPPLGPASAGGACAAGAG